MTNRTVFLGLGSNMGGSRQILEGALDRLSETISNMQVSSLYSSKPRYMLDQPDFLNLVVSGASALPPLSLLEETQMIENDFGRIRLEGKQKKARTLDIDILLYGELLSEKQEILIPHPGISERKFVLVPLLELDPNLIDPRTGRPYAEDLMELDEQGIFFAELDCFNFDTGIW